MRYMRWSYDDLMRCPQDYVPVILEQAVEEKRKFDAEQARVSARRGRR